MNFQLFFFFSTDPNQFESRVIIHQFTNFSRGSSIWKKKNAEAFRRLKLFQRSEDTFSLPTGIAQSFRHHFEWRRRTNQALFHSPHHMNTFDSHRCHCMIILILLPMRLNTENDNKQFFFIADTQYADFEYMWMLHISTWVLYIHLG